MPKTKKCPDCKGDIPKNAKKCMHCGSKQPMSGFAAKLLLFLVVLFGISVYSNSVRDRPKAATPEQISQAAANAKIQANIKKIQRENTITRFNRDKSFIIKNATTLLKTGKYSDLINIARQYAVVKDPDLMVLRSKAREKQLLAIAKALPASQIKANRDAYQKLASIRPDNQHYKNKIKFYQKKLDRKATEIIARKIAFGDPPVQSAWDGSYRVVEQYLKQIANDPDSIDINKCTDVYHIKTGWLVGCIYRGKNAFGGTVRNGNWFTIVHNRVIKMDKFDRYKW